MTPFDATALLAILLAFYQPASSENLARAFSERPEYFAGGELIGTHGDALRLPDGTIWDLIFAVDGPEPSAYQAIIPSGSSDAGGDPLFRLTPGPFTPLHADALRIVAAGEVFAPIVADAIGALHELDGALASHASDLADGSTATDGIAAAGTELDDGAPALREELGGLAAAIPDDVLTNTDAHANTIPLHEAPYDDPAPGYASTDVGAVPPELPEHQSGGSGSGEEGASPLGQTPETKGGGAGSGSDGSSSGNGSGAANDSGGGDGQERQEA